MFALQEYLEELNKKLIDITIQARKNFSDEFIYIFNQIKEHELKIKTIKENQK